jgi:hypothetical protein
VVGSDAEVQPGMFKRSLGPVEVTVAGNFWDMHEGRLAYNRRFKRYIDGAIESLDLGVFKVEQLQALALMFLRLRAPATGIFMVFFGWYCLLIGYLIFRSTFLPRILGVFMAIAGMSYQLFLSPLLASYLFSFIVKPAGALGELSLVLWLLVMGVNSQRWKDQASAAGMRT